MCFLEYDNEIAYKAQYCTHTLSVCRLHEKLRGGGPFLSHVSILHTPVHKCNAFSFSYNDRMVIDSGRCPSVLFEVAPSNT